MQLDLIHNLTTPRNWRQRPVENENILMCK